MSWRLVANPDGSGALAMPAAALDAPPEWFDGELGEVLLPRHRVNDRCRICGRHTGLTREHIPPQEAANSHRSYARSLDDWLHRNNIQPPKGRHVHGGVWGYTLCAACNSLTGTRYGNEYIAWAARGFNILPSRSELDAKENPGSVKVWFKGVDPGSFVRQILSCMCTLSSDWDLARWRPSVRNLVLDGEAGELPEGIGLGMRLYIGPAVRVAGPSVVVDRLSGDWAWVMEMAYPPFAILMTLAASKPPGGLDISDFTQHQPGERLNFEAVFDLGAGHTVLPGDYRTAAAITAERMLEKAATDPQARGVEKP